LGLDVLFWRVTGTALSTVQTGRKTRRLLYHQGGAGQQLAEHTASSARDAAPSQQYGSDHRAGEGTARHFPYEGISRQDRSTNLT
jgi:hypothetical protein